MRLISHQSDYSLLDIFRPLDDPAAEGLVDFHVYHKQEHRYGKTHVSFVKQVYVVVYGYEIILMKGGVVLVS